MSGLVWGQIGMTGRTAICFVISILVARFLGAAQYGIYAAIVSFVALLTQFANMGIGTIFSTYIPRFRSADQPGECSYVVRHVIIIRAILLAGIVAVVHAFSGPLVESLGEAAIHDYILITLIWFLIHGLKDGFIFTIWANLNMKLFAAVELTVSLIQLAGVIFLISHGITVRALALLMIAVNTIQLVSYLVGSIPTIRPKPVKTDLVPVLKLGATVWFAGVLYYFRDKSIDVLMILFFLRNTASAAYYDIAYMVALYGGYVLLTAVEKLALPILSEAHTRYGLEGLRKAWEFLTKVSIYLTAPILVFLIAHADSIIRVLYSDAYREASPLLVGFSVFTLIAVFFANRISVMVLFPLNRERTYLYLCSFNGILNIILNLALIPRYGITGAVIATGGSSLLVTIMEFVIAVRAIRARPPVGFIFTMLLVTGVSISWTLFVKSYSLSLLVAVAIIYGIIVTFLMLKSYTFEEREKEILQEVQPGIHAFLLRYKLLK